MDTLFTPPASPVRPTVFPIITPIFVVLFPPYAQCTSPMPSIMALMQHTGAKNHATDHTTWHLHEDRLYSNQKAPINNETPWCTIPLAAHEFPRYQTPYRPTACTCSIVTHARLYTTSRFNKPHSTQHCTRIMLYVIRLTKKCPIHTVLWAQAKRGIWPKVRMSQNARLWFRPPTGTILLSRPHLGATMPYSWSNKAQFMHCTHHYSPQWSTITWPFLNKGNGSPPKRCM